MTKTQVTYYTRGQGLQSRTFDTLAEAGVLWLNLSDDPDVVFRELRILQA